MCVFVFMFMCERDDCLSRSFVNNHRPRVCVQHRCVFPLHPPAISISVPAAEACGLQRVAAAVLTAGLGSGPCTSRYADYTG